MLMLDRYLVADQRALDLATGCSVRCHTIRAGGPRPDLFTHRRGWWLIDQHHATRSVTEVWERAAADALSAPTDPPALDAVQHALDGARDGRPQTLDVTLPSLAAWARATREIARLVRLSGFVPIAAEALGAVMTDARWRWPPWLQDRSLVVIASEGHLPGSAAVALLRLATRDQRPHLIVRGVTSQGPWRSRLMNAPARVHEAIDTAPAERETPEALARRALALADSGPAAQGEAAARWAVMLADSAEVRAAGRCALARCLLNQDRLLEARAAMASLDGADAAGLAAPWVADLVSGLRADLAAREQRPRQEWAIVDDVLNVLRICQDIEDEQAALTKVATFLRDRLSASNVSFVVRECGTATAIIQAGVGTASLDVATRAIETGVAVPPANRDSTVDGAWPVRYGASVVGAVWCRWSLGLPLLSDDASTMIGLAAAAAAPSLHAAVERRRAPQTASVEIPELIGNSEVMQNLRTAILRAATSPFPVLVEGESGSGKELVAKAIHAASQRRDRRFCALNCAALADGLVEAELFGHARGAFTGAMAERAGLFEDAQGGTLFLDEVGELGGRVQAKLLRVLQEAEVRRLGESRVRRVDVRIVAATNRSLAAEVEQDRFRRDLWYRLDVIRVTVPPLRARLEDIPALVRHVWHTLGERTGHRTVLSPSALAALGAYDWPGNVRELQNVLASMMVAGPRRGPIGADTLPTHIARVTALGRPASLAEARHEFEARFVRAALARAGGRSTSAARELGVSRQGLLKLTRRLGIVPP
jgi:DNA-binding NtrC family response regulator